jgi:hypothetical protein
MTLTSEKAPGYYTNTPNKPKGRSAKRMAFYSHQRAMRGIVLHRLLVG